jgi:protein phosphatase
MRLVIPRHALVILIGASGSGKSTFGCRHFKPTEVLSSDACRAMVCDDETNMRATRDAFELLHFIVEKRLAAGRLTVVDATNVQPGARRPLLEMASRFRRPVVGIVLDLPASVCLAWNQSRLARSTPEPAVRRQIEQLRRSLASLDREGYQCLYHLTSVRDIASVALARQ